MVSQWHGILIVIAIGIVSGNMWVNQTTNSNELQCLRQLPMEQLLRIQKGLNELSVVQKDVERMESRMGDGIEVDAFRSTDGETSQALPLIGNHLKYAVDSC